MLIFTHGNRAQSAQREPVGTNTHPLHSRAHQAMDYPGDESEIATYTYREADTDDRENALVSVHDSTPAGATPEPNVITRDGVTILSPKLLVPRIDNLAYLDQKADPTPMARPGQEADGTGDESVQSDDGRSDTAAAKSSSNSKQHRRYYSSSHRSSRIRYSAGRYPRYQIIGLAAGRRIVVIRH